MVLGLHKKQLIEIKIMQNYHPSQSPAPDEWLEIDESTRVDLVRDYHEMASTEFQDGAEDMHALIHVVVENQIAMNVEPVPATIAKLTRQGLKRHEAIHAVGAIIAEDLFELFKNNQAFDIKRYRRRLDKLTAKRWMKGQY